MLSGTHNPAIIKLLTKSELMHTIMKLLSSGKKYTNLSEGTFPQPFYPQLKKTYATLMLLQRALLQPWMSLLAMICQALGINDSLTGMIINDPDRMCSLETSSSQDTKLTNIINQCGKSIDLWGVHINPTPLNSSKGWIT